MDQRVDQMVVLFNGGLSYVLLDSFIDLEKLPKDCKAEVLPVVSLPTDVFFLLASKIPCGRDVKFSTQLARNTVLIRPINRGKDGIIL